MPVGYQIAQECLAESVWRWVPAFAGITSKSDEHSQIPLSRPVSDLCSLVSGSSPCGHHSHRDNLHPHVNGLLSMTCNRTTPLVLLPLLALLLTACNRDRDPA
ncbi:MAG: hypothetical protein M3Q13_00330, partial [Pseudomonadota bacterium]|nr:hypothetical protein [Pseudomonadota bacterium]